MGSFFNKALTSISGKDKINVIVNGLDAGVIIYFIEMYNHIQNRNNIYSWEDHDVISIRIRD